MLKTAPDPVDVQDLQFKLHCRLKVFENVDGSNFPQHCSLVASASQFGLVFVGTNSSILQVIQVNDIEKYTKSDGDKVNYPRRNFSLVSQPSHLSVNGEHTILAVVVKKNDCPWCLFYDVNSFWQQEVIQIREVCLSSTPNVTITEVNWNPTLAMVFTACKSDGSLGVYEIKSGGVDINELPVAAGATCFSWSPKGKQIAVGSRDGKITQLKPDLKAVKIISAPPLKEAHTLLALQWVSNYQFIGVFQPNHPNGQALFMVIDAPKSGDITYINYDDICYSNGCARPVQFYTILLHHWNILMAASSNSMEVGILGTSGESWTQWIMGDAARAELPLSSDHQETLPIGCALEIGSRTPIPWGESSLPPAPFLLLLSHHGMLCCFSVINLKESAPSICSPPNVIKDTSGLRHFVAGTEGKVPNDASKVQQKVQMTPEPPSTTNIKPLTTNITISSAQTPLKSQPPVIPSQDLNLSKTLNLFGGQATLSPITQANKTVQPLVIPQYQSFFPSSSSGESKTPSASSIQIPAISTNASSANPVGATSVVTIPSGANNLTKVDYKELTEGPSKLEVANIDLKAEEETEKIFTQMVKEECIFLESEIKVVLHHGKSLKLNLGSDEDKIRLLESTKLLEDFFHEVLDICVTQNSEVHILKQNLLQSWAWYEEAKSRHLAAQDESMMILMRAQPLDSASEKQRADIQHTNYYLDSQISQAHLALDEQWENFQDYCKKTHKIQIPTMEMIFQTMVKQNAILRKQSYVLKDIATRLKTKSRSAVGPSLLISVDAAKDLPHELKRLRMNPDDICELQYEHVTNRLKNLTKVKVDNLRLFLKKRDYVHISAVKPQLSTSLIQTSPSSKLKHYSSGVSQTPLFKELPAKKLDFEHSTPKPLVSKSEGLIASDRPGPAIDGLQKFAQKFEAKHLATLNESKSFAPLTKNVIASSPNSAFVTPTTVKLGILNLPAAVPTIPAVGKSFVSVSTLQEASRPVSTVSDSTLSKPFSLIGSSPVVSSEVSKPSANIFSDSAAKPNAEGTPSRTPVFGTADTNAMAFKSEASVFKVTVKPSPSTVTGHNLISSTKSTTAVTNLTTTIGNAPVTSSFAFGSATTSAFSFGSASGSNIFGLASQKVETFDSAASTTKSAVIFPKSIPTTTLPHPSSSKSSSSSTSTSFFGSLENSTSTKFTTTTSQPSLFSSPSVTSQKKNSAVTSTQPSIFGDIAASTPVAVLSLSSTKSPFATVTSTIMSSPTIATSVSTSITASTPVVGTSNVTNVAVTTGPSFSTASTPGVFGAQLTSKATTTTTNVSTFLTFTSTSQSSTPKTNIFGSTPVTTGSNSSPFPVGTSSTGFSFVSTSANKSAVFNSSDSNVSKTSIFGGAPVAVTSLAATPTTTTQSQIFGATPSTLTSTFAVSTTPSTQTSLFGTSSTSVSNYGSSTASTTRASIFGTPTATSVFGTPVTTTTQPVFGTPVTTTTPSVFGTPVTTTTPSVFGTAVSTSSNTLLPSTAPSVFGSSTSNQTSIFGTTAAATTPQSIFGNTAATTTVHSQGFGIFGDGSQKSSVFSSASTGSTQSSIFGGTNQTTAFGNATTSAFGQSVFGSSGSTFGGSSGFGASGSTFGQSSGTIFGGTPSTTTSIFGGSATAGSTFAPSGTVFGTAVSSAASPFGSSSIFSNTTQSSSFSGSTNTGAFGFGSLNVGSTATTSSSGFGSATSNPFANESKSVFGSPAVSSSTSTFGASSGGSLFGASSQTFGGSGFGRQSSPFGQQSTFGQSSFGGTGFGQSPSGPFSAASSGSVGDTGFGTGSTFQKPGFGGSPVFGGSPAFGSVASFGAAPSFGSPPTFGSPPKVFGSTSTGFGAATGTQNAGFGNLANQATVGFGNLAQQAANSAATNAPFSGSSSFSSWR